MGKIRGREGIKKGIRGGEKGNKIEKRRGKEGEKKEANVRKYGLFRDLQPPWPLTLQSMNSLYISGLSSSFSHLISSSAAVCVCEDGIGG